MGSRAVFPSPPLPAGEALGLPPQLGGPRVEGRLAEAFVAAGRRWRQVACSARLSLRPLNVK